jgi:hypothetical protein
MMTWTSRAKLQLGKRKEIRILLPEEVVRNSQLADSVQPGYTLSKARNYVYLVEGCELRLQTSDGSEPSLLRAVHAAVLQSNGCASCPWLVV